MRCERCGGFGRLAGRGERWIFLCPECYGAGKRPESAAGGVVADEPEITAEMVEAGEDVLLGKTGGADDLGPRFVAADVARLVYVAMWRASQGVKDG